MRKMKSGFLVAILMLLLFGTTMNAQTTLTTGDIAFTGYNADYASVPNPDQFSFIILKTGGIASGTTINFTSVGWVGGTCGTSSNWSDILGCTGSDPDAGELLVWTATTNMAYGTQVTITTNSASSGTCTGAGISLPNSGDQIFAFQGNRTGAHTLITGIHANVYTGLPSSSSTTDALWDDYPFSSSASCNSNASNKPSCFTTGVNCLILKSSGGAEVDNGRVNPSSVCLTGNPAIDRAAINNYLNWQTDDINVVSLPPALPNCAPAVTTNAATAVSGSGATLNGAVNDRGFTTTVSFVYGTSSSLASGNTTVSATPSSISAGTGSTSVTKAITGLSGGTTYYFRATAVNANGTTDGSILNFTTSASNATPTFSGGSPQSLTVCQNASATSINGLLTVNDADIGQTLTWTATSGPAHGTLNLAGTSATTGSNVTPSGKTYIPTTGYSGPDAFTIQVSDGSGGTATTVINVTVNPLPNPGAISGATSVCAGSTTTLTASGTGGGVWSSTNTGIATVSSSGIVNGLSAGTTTISYAVSNGCGTVAATFVITVNPLATPGTISGSNSVCVAATISLTASGSGGGAWSSTNTSSATVSGSGVVSGLSSGTSTISYSVTNSCGTVAATKVVTVNTLPTPGAITGSSSVCQGAMLALTATGTAGGTWTSTNTATATVSTSGSVNGISAGTSIISYSVTNVCGTESATKTVTVNPLATPGTISGPTATYVGSQITLNASGTGGGAWVSSNTAIATISTTGVLSGIAVGTTSVSYTVANICGSVSTVATINVVAPAAGMAINNTGAEADNSAMLDVSSSTQGALMPRMTAAQRVALTSPATGLLVYQTDGSAGFYFFDGSAWTNLNAPSTATLAGNTFNGASQLLQLNGSGQMPVVSGANLTNLPAANLTGTMAAVNGSNITNLSGSNITTGSIPVSKVSATGAASATTYLRGDGTWSVPSAGSSVAVQLIATQGGGQTITAGTASTILWTSPSVNVSSQYNTGTGIFTAATAGDYLVTATLGAPISLTRVLSIVVNSTPVFAGGIGAGIGTVPSGIPGGSAIVSGVVSLSAGDQLSVSMHMSDLTSTTTSATVNNITIVKLN